MHHPSYFHYGQFFLDKIMAMGKVFWNFCIYSIEFYSFIYADCLQKNYKMNQLYIKMFDFQS